MHNCRLISAFSVIAAITLPLLSQAANASESPDAGKTQASSSLFIKATPTIVWQAVHDQRQEDPGIEYSKIIEDNGSIKLLEQKFLKIPMLGSVTAVTRQVEAPFQRIDYTLVSSDKFKALNGCWKLTPLNGGTMLELSSYLDIGVPFSNVFIKLTAQKTLKHRLAEVKRLAETQQIRVSQKL